MKTSDRMISLVDLILFTMILGCSSASKKIASSQNHSFCGLRYLWQAALGQFSILNQARPLTEAATQLTLDSKTRDLLKKVPALKLFANQHGLKSTSAYESYVKLNRDAASYVVTACEPLKFQAKEWSFPIVGSFTYLGWFDPKDARNYARELREEGWDVSIRGASAYSTLGWFEDPIFSTMISQNSGIADFVNTLLHESVHKTVYIWNQTPFNESLAQFVADVLMQEALIQVFHWEKEQLLSWEKTQKKRKALGASIQKIKAKLDEIYSSAESDAQKYEQKAEQIAIFEKEWNLNREVNNAFILGFTSYETGTEELEALFNRSDRNVPLFLKKLSTLTRSDFQKNHETHWESILRKI